MSFLLLEVLKDIPPHVHVGILLAATVPSSDSEDAATTFSYIDLSSPLPHMLQFVAYEDEEEDEEEGDDGDGENTSAGGLLDKMALVPADSLHLPNIHAAIRSLVDYDPSQLATTQRSYTMSMPLGKSVETILDYMDHAQHPGQVEISSSEGEDPLEDKILYAGGKIMTFLASCPTDLRGEDWRPLTRKYLPKTKVGLGGFGGAVHKNGAVGIDATSTDAKEMAPPLARRFKGASDEEAGYATASAGINGDDEITDTDMTPASLLDYYRAPDHVEAYFQELGSQCADAALGVDIFVLVQPQEDDGYMGGDDNAELDVGLPFLRELADRSGAPGPLIFPLHQGYATPIKANPDIQRFQNEIHARVPWGGYGGETAKEEEDTAAYGKHGEHQPMAFGGELRLRLSTSFVVDKSPVDEVDEGPQLAPLYSSGGIMGPASEEEESGNLWRMGTCDPYMSVTVDLDMKDKEAKDKLNVDGMGEIAWKPVIQTCFAYTAIVKDPEHPGQYLTVRQMRIACARVPLTENVETLYSSIDPEVIGSVLFHKLTLTLLRDGLSMAQTIGEDWLRSLLVCAYQSAETQESIQRDQVEHGLPQHDANGDSEGNAVAFYANERLLDREGELPAEDVLLAQGHELLKTLPLVVYALLHCDAIRPSSSLKTKPTSNPYFPTLDARCAAGAQMSSMNPPVLSKCLAPRLQLWSCSQGLILDMLDLRMEAVRLAVEEFGSDASTGKARDDLVLFLDAPDCLVVCDASFVSKNYSSSKKELSVGPALQHAVNRAVHNYRTPPSIIYNLGNADNKEAPGFLRLLASLVEDLPGTDGAHNFKEWRDNLAGDIHE